MKFCLTAAVLSALILAESGVAAPNKEKEALQTLNDFVGSWKGNGAPIKNNKPTSDGLWSETVNWGWKFKGDDAWVILEFKDGKFFKSAEIRYVVADKKFKLTFKDVNDKEQVFFGELSKDGFLIVERKDEEKKITQQLTMNTAAEGARFIYTSKFKRDGSTIYIKEYEVACTREGVTLGPKEKKVECVVSGGLGTMQVSFKGETFYVCCGGCRDAFNENPEKYIKEFKAKKKQ